MEEAHFRIEVSQIPDRTVLCLFGELDLASAAALEQELGRFAGDTRVVLDLRRLEFIDSTGLSVLVKSDQRAAGTDGELVILSAGDGQVRRLLDLTGLGERLTVVEALEDLTTGS